MVHPKVSNVRFAPFADGSGGLSCRQRQPDDLQVVAVEARLLAIVCRRHRFRAAATRGYAARRVSFRRQCAPAPCCVHHWMRLGDCQMPTNWEAGSVTRNLGALIGRALMSAIFIWSGYGKLVAAAGTTAYFASLGVTLPGAAWLVAVVVELGGGLALLLGIYTRPAALGLAAWSIATAVVAHSNFADHNMQIHFMKNVAIAGGFIFLVVFGAGTYTIERAVLRTR
jgi:putative oxidoreductase